MYQTPARKIPKNYRNITGKFSSLKSNKLIGYESKLERDYLFLFELSNLVVRIVEQPVTIEYGSSNKLLRYTPDFYLETSEHINDIIVEVKYYDELKAIFPSEKYKYGALQENMRESSVDFYLCTDRCPYIQSKDYRFNTSFLLNYNTLSSLEYDVIKDLFVPNITVQCILDKYSMDRYKQLALISSIWCMIRRGILKVNLFSRLSFETQLLEFIDSKQELLDNLKHKKIEKSLL